MPGLAEQLDDGGVAHGGLERQDAAGRCETRVLRRDSGPFLGNGSRQPVPLAPVGSHRHVLPSRSPDLLPVSARNVHPTSNGPGGVTVTKSIPLRVRTIKRAQLQARPSLASVNPPSADSSAAIP